MKSFSAALVVLALLTPWACQASSQGRELKQDLSTLTSFIGSSGIPNIGGGSSGMPNIGSFASSLSSFGGSSGMPNIGSLSSIAGASPNPISSFTSGGSGGIGNIASSLSGGRKMLKA